jgi:hypothetical protein
LQVMKVLIISFMLSGCGEHTFTDQSRAFGPEVDTNAPLKPVKTHIPTTLGVADTLIKDANGKSVGVACDTCHGPNPDQAWVSLATNHEKAHSGIELNHGTLSCNFCHDSKDRTKLHLADGEKLDMTDAMTLCAQCHGVQFRDYKKGSHGGMSGYWDRRRGPQDRNHCVDCHAPHSPAYESVMPVHPPRDRHLDSDTHEGEH